MYFPDVNNKKYNTDLHQIWANYIAYYSLPLAIGILHSSVVNVSIGAIL